MRFSICSLLALCGGIHSASAQTNWNFTNLCGNNLWSYCCSNGLPCDEGGAATNNWIPFVTCPCPGYPTLLDNVEVHLPMTCNSGSGGAYAGTLWVTQPFRCDGVLEVSASAVFDAPVLVGGIIYGGAAFAYNQPVTTIPTIIGETDIGIGVHTFNSTLSIPANAPCTITGDVRNTLLTTWDGDTVLTVDGAYSPVIPGGIIRNQPSATFLITGNGTMRGLIGLGYFTNAGTLRKQGGTGTTVIGSRLTNFPSGVIDVATGSLSVVGSQSEYDGSVSIAPGADMHLGSDLSTLGNVFFSGPGLLFADGNITVRSGATATVRAMQAFNIQRFGLGTLMVTSLFDARAMTFDDAGTTIIAPGATMLLAAPFRTLVLNGHTLRNSGTVSWLEESFVVNVGASIQNEAGGLFEANSSGSIGGLFGDGTFVNRGTFRKPGPLTPAATTVTIPFLNDGLVELAGFARFNALTQSPTGVIRLDGGRLVEGNNQPFVLNGGRLTGTGSVIWGLANSGGIIAPGTPGSPFGIITIGGDGFNNIFTQAPGGTLDFELGGTTPGLQHDQLNAADPIVLGGTLNVSLFGGYVPNPGDTFTILTGLARIGEFDAVNLPPGMTITYTSNAVVLSVPNPCDPDLNQDGNADQDDVAYLINVVAGGENSTGIDPDFNHDGNVDQDDVAALINVVAGGPCP